jgi:Na+/H+ antiporter NhaD/arsenite permease-like protein
MLNTLILGAATAGHDLDPNPWMMIPFGLLLLCIAVMPLFFGKWWHHNYPFVAIALGAIPVVYYLLQNAGDRLMHVAHEYVSFLALIGSLFVIAGGIHISVKGESKPWINVLFLFIGAVVSNFIGTTGASMLLVRPWIRMNKYRITSFHIVFFIFIVSNAGGCLTPIGDPPLFLGYLRGVPFLWVLEHCWVAWLIAVGALLLIFYVFDSINFRKPPKDVTERLTAHETWRFEGLPNLFWIAVVIGAVLANKQLPLLVPELIMVAAAVASYLMTGKQIHEANHFNFEPIKEVAILFLGIFGAMIPALDFLQHHAADLGLKSPMHFYWVTGALSSFLDNAPTYLTMLSAEMGLHHLDVNKPAEVLSLARDFPHDLIAISMGAVFFGAMTYIGNGPNFMVKSIAHHAKCETPTFFGYLFAYAIPILLPVLALIALLFFSPWAIF